MTAAAIENIPTVGNWVELIRPRKGRSYLGKGSTWLVESVNPDKQVAKVNNGKSGESYKFEHLYFEEISPSSQFKKGDIVQHDEDARYIGRVTLPGENRVKVKWATGPEEYVSPTVLSLFVRMVKGNQEILREYAFKVGDKVSTIDANHQGTIFTVRECYPSGMVGLTSDTEHDISLPGCWLNLVESANESESEPDQVLVPQPENYRNFEDFNAAYDKYLEELWEGDDDIAQTEEQFTNAEELWNQYQYSLETEPEAVTVEVIDASSSILFTDPPRQLEEGGQYSIFWEDEEAPDPDDFKSQTDYEIAYQQWSEKFPKLAEAIAQRNTQKSSWEIFPATSETLDWVDPHFVDLIAGTQTRTGESNGQIAIYSEKMQSGEWEWKREPLPELVKDGDVYYVVSGNHRIKAALLASKPDEETESEPVLIYCRIIPGTLEDAKLLAIRSNANDYHGVPESRADFRNRVNKFLDLLDTWDAATQIRELEQLKQQPYATEATGAIDQLLAKLQQGISEGWSNRIIATYLQSPRSYRTIGNLLNSRQTEGIFNSVKSGLTYGNWIQFENEGEMQSGRISYLSTTTITVIKLDKTYLTINRDSSLGLLKSIARLEPVVESEQQKEDSPTPPPQKSVSSGGGGSSGGSGRTFARDSVSQELNAHAQSLGLPTSPNQVLPDTSNGDRAQNASPYDVDDRPFASPVPTVEQIRNECLIGFISNAGEMTQPMIRRALESILDWMESHDKTENLGYLKTVINDL